MSDGRYTIYILKNNSDKVVMIDGTLYETGEIYDDLRTEIKEYCDDEYGYYFDTNKLFRNKGEVYRLECETCLFQSQEGNEYEEYVLSVELVGKIKYK